MNINYLRQKPLRLCGEVFGLTRLPISRVLSLGDHLSRPIVTHKFKQLNGSKTDSFLYITDNEPPCN